MKTSDVNEYTVNIHRLTQVHLENGC